MQVHLIQYKRPDGHQVDVFCEVSDELKPQYELIRKLGLNFSCEVLHSNLVSLVLEHKLLGLDFKAEICKNEPGLPKETLEKMLREFSEKEFKREASRLAKTDMYRRTNEVRS